MAQSKASTVDQYMLELPEDRREILAKVRQVLLDNLHEGFRERMNWGSISYEIPLSDYPDTYNKQPLYFAGLASNKQYISLHLMCAYQDSAIMDQIRAAFANANKKLNMGKSCIRFKNLDQIPLEEIGKLIGKITPQEFIKTYEASKK